MTRVYLPISGPQLAALVTERVLAGPLAAYAVTAGLESALPEADADELEYAALMAAGDASRDLGGEADSPRRVVAAEVDSELADLVAALGAGVDGEHPASVRISEPLTWAQVVSAHVDLAPGAPADDDLAWFAPQEIAGLL